MEVNFEHHKDVPIYHYKEFQRFEPIALSHSSMDAFKKCARYGLFTVIMGLRSKGWAPQFAWGTAYHLFRETLTKSYGFGDDTPEKWDEEKGHQAFTRAAAVGLAYWVNNSQSTIGIKDYEFMTTARLIQSFQHVYKFWKEERQRGSIKVLACEQYIVIQLPDGSFTSGRVDELIEWNFRLWGRDHKTSRLTEEYYERYVTPNDQFTRYTYLQQKISGRIVDGIVIDVLYNANPTKKDTKGPLMYRKLATRTSEELQTWEKHEIFGRRQLKVMRDEDTYPMNETQCPKCSFRSVCSRPTEAAQVQKLKQYYDVAPFDNSKSDYEDEQPHW